jgi:hypothetical protein
MSFVRMRLVLLICLLLTAGRAGAQEAPAAEQPTPQPSPGAGKSVMFQIALVLADNEASQGPPQTSQTSQTMPKGLQKALADIQDFLPFKSYRLFDSALVRASGRGRATLKGPDGPYNATFTFRDDGDARNGILVDQFALDKMPAPSPQPLPRGVAPRTPEPPQVSSFRIRRGETVVVGSSGLAGGKSLIVILTALP